MPYSFSANTTTDHTHSDHVQLELMPQKIMIDMFLGTTFYCVPNARDTVSILQTNDMTFQ